MSRPTPSRRQHHSTFVRVNGKIRAREVRVVTSDGKQLGILPLGEAINLARSHGLDLVEIAASANPPVCRIVDYGKFRYEQSKKEKETKKHQHGTKVKEVQLRPAIDPHDFHTKLVHATEFLCEEMKVKISLRFRGREMAHKEIGYDVVKRFVQELAPYGLPDAPIKSVGRAIHVMVSPLPRNKRAKNPRAETSPNTDPSQTKKSEEHSDPAHVPTDAAENPSSTKFTNNPFSHLPSAEKPA